MAVRRRGSYIFKTVGSQMAVRLSILRAGCPLPHGRFLVLLSVRSCVGPKDHSAAGRIRSIEKSSDLIGSRTRGLPACGIVPQPTTLPRAPERVGAITICRA
jgi:hypothetical protein